MKALIFLDFQSGVWGGKMLQTCHQSTSVHKSISWPSFSFKSQRIASSEIWPEHWFYSQHFSLFPWQRCGIPSPPWAAWADCGISQSSSRLVPGLFCTANTARQSSWYQISLQLWTQLHFILFVAAMHLCLEHTKQGEHRNVHSLPGGSTNTFTPFQSTNISVFTFKLLLNPPILKTGKLIFYPSFF